MTAIAALPFFGGTLACFNPSDNTVIEVTTAGKYDTTFATSALQVQSVSSATSPTWPVAATLWTRFSLFSETAFSALGDSNVFLFFNGATNVAKVTVNNNTVGFLVMTYKLWTLQGGVMTVVGTVSVPQALQTLDVKLVGNSASGSAALYVAGTQAFNVGSLNHAGWSGVTQIVMGSGLNVTEFSQIICDASSTVGRFLRTDRLNTNSATNTGWTGTVSDINEIPTSDSNFISAASANLVDTFYESGLNLGTLQILARGIGARFRAEDVSGPQNLQLAIRSGSSNFFSASIAATTGFQAAFNSWTADPNTSLGWTDSNAASAESGVKSIT